MNLINDSLYKQNVSNLELSEKMENFSKILSDFGISNTAFSNPKQKEEFFKLNNQSIDRIKYTFLPFYHLCQRLLEDKEDLKDNHQLIWRIIKELGGKPCSDLFDKLDKGDVIEIYDRNSIQIFRNLEFFKICSYSMHEVFSYELWELYNRGSEISFKLQNTVSEVFKKNIKNTVVAGVPDHIVSEKFSEGRKSYIVKQKYISPILDQNSLPLAVLGSFRVIKEVRN